MATTNLTQLERGASFTWGHVVAIHKIGPYAIVEFRPTRYDTNPPRVADAISFYPYVMGQDWSHTYATLDAALCACIVYRLGGFNAVANGNAAECMMRVATPRGES